MTRLNLKQRWVIWAMGTALLLVLVYPPWWYSWTVYEHATQHPQTSGHIDWSLAFREPKPLAHIEGVEWNWFFSKPLGPGGEDDHNEFGLEYKRWATEVVLVLTVGGGMIWALKEN